MRRKTGRKWLLTLVVVLTGVLLGCQSFGKEEQFGYGMGGLDHLADHLSVTDFWVNGAAGFQAGNGNAGVSAPLLPVKWHPGLTVHVVWDVRDWKHDKGHTYEADVPVEPYDEGGANLWVHFLADGKVRAVVSSIGPRASRYPGPHDPIPQKRPWDMYPPRGDWRDSQEHLADIAIARQRCMATVDPAACAKQARESLLDEQRADARRYLPRCARITTWYLYEECEKQALRNMRAARLARRCQLARDLPECMAREAELGASQAAKTTGALDQ